MAQRSGGGGGSAGMVVTTKPACVHVGVKGSGCHGVDGDAAFADVYGEGGCEHLDRPRA